MVVRYFLMGFPRFDQIGPCLVAQVHSATGHPHETVGSYLSATNQRHNKTVGQRPQFLGKIKRKRRPADLGRWKNPIW